MTPPPPDPGSRWSAGRLVLLALGLALMAWGAVVGVTSIPMDEWLSVGLWLAGGVAVHDAVLAPLAVLLGLAVLPRVRPGLRGALRGGALGAGVLAVFAVAVIAGAAGRRDPSVVPLAQSTSLAAAAGVLVGAVLVGALVQHALAVRSARRARARPRPPREQEPLE